MSEQCGEFSHVQMRNVPGGMMSNMVVVKATIDSIDRVEKTAEITLLTFCEGVVIPTEDVQFHYHCEFSEGSETDLEEGHWAFEAGETVAVVHVPATNESEATTAIFEHVDLSGLKPCIKEVLVLKVETYVAYEYAVTMFDLSTGEVLVPEDIVIENDPSPVDSPGAFPMIYDQDFEDWLMHYFKSPFALIINPVYEITAPDKYSIRGDSTPTYIDSGSVASYSPGFSGAIGTTGYKYCDYSEWMYGQHYLSALYSDTQEEDPYTVYVHNDYDIENTFKMTYHYTVLDSTTVEYHSLGEVVDIIANKAWAASGTIVLSHVWRDVDAGYDFQAVLSDDRVYSQTQTKVPADDADEGPPPGCTFPYPTIATVWTYEDLFTYSVYCPWTNDLLVSVECVRDYVLDSSTGETGRLDDFASYFMYADYSYEVSFGEWGMYTFAGYHTVKSINYYINGALDTGSQVIEYSDVHLPLVVPLTRMSSYDPTGFEVGLKEYVDARHYDLTVGLRDCLDELSEYRIEYNEGNVSYKKILHSVFIKKDQVI